MGAKMNHKFLEINGLEAVYSQNRKAVHAVNGISLLLERGKTIGLVGETGAGKTTIAKSIMRILPDIGAKITKGEIWLDGEDVLTKSEEEMLNVRGKKAAMIFQDPMTALNPLQTVGEQILEVILLHSNCDKNEGVKRAGDMLEMVGIPRDRYFEYPHQFSGGMKQRVVIAMALACDPELLLADEPTTALDVTIQAQVLDLIKNLRDKYDTSMILITHDLGVVAETCDMVAVIYAGKIVEYGTKEDIFDYPGHPYTKGLFGSLPSMAVGETRLHSITGLPPDPTNLPAGCAFGPRCPHAMKECGNEIPNREITPGHFCLCVKDGNRDESLSDSCQAEVKQGVPQCKTSKKEGTKLLIEVKNLKKYFTVPAGVNHAVDDVSFNIYRGQTLGVVGESGCGKSTLGRAIIRLLEPTDGTTLLNGENITHVKGMALKKAREKMQIVFQDPYSSLNPRLHIESTITEPLKFSRRFSSGKALREEANRLMDLVGIDSRLRQSYPHELDGGRRQRVGIARALALNPDFVVCDEPVSALDVSIQAQVLNLLMDLQEEIGMAYMFVTHDLSVVRHIADDILVMYLGQAVEKAPTNELFDNPLHPYTRALLSAIPSTDIHNPMQRIQLKGEITSAINPKPGCRFAARCPYAADGCQNPQILEEILPDHFVQCWRCKEINNIKKR